MLTSKSCQFTMFRPSSMQCTMHCINCALIIIMGEEDLNQLLSLLEKQNLISLLTYLTSDVVGKKLAAKNIEIIKKFLSPSKSIDETSLSTKKDISKKQLKQDNFEISK